MASTVSPINMKLPTKMIRPRPKKNTSDKNNNELTCVTTTMTIPEPYIDLNQCQGGIDVHSNDEILKCGRSASPEQFHHQETEEENSYCDPELFVKHQIKRTLLIPFYKLTKNVNVKYLLKTELVKSIGGRCSVEGYICPNSVSIYSHSSGTLSAGNILFDVAADCLICFPDENSIIKCVAKTITQAGIRGGARYLGVGNVSPIEVFLSRDMHSQTRELFTQIEEGDILTVKIIGRRFVLHDSHVTIIAMLLDVENE